MRRARPKADPHKLAMAPRLKRGQFLGALFVDGSGNGYLETACDYVHLNPVRAGLFGPGAADFGLPVGDSGVGAGQSQPDCC